MNEYLINGTFINSKVAMNDWILNVYNVYVSRMNECNNNNVRSDKKKAKFDKYTQLVK